METIRIISTLYIDLILEKKRNVIGDLKNDLKKNGNVENLNISILFFFCLIAFVEFSFHFIEKRKIKS